MTESTIHKEAETLSRYLIGQPCNAEIAASYQKAISVLGAEFSPAQQNIWDRMVSNRFILRAIDSGLGLLSPAHILRKRIFIMLCLLETNEKCTRFFLPQQRTVLYLIPLGLKGVRAVLFAIFGIGLIKWHRIN